MIARIVSLRIRDRAALADDEQHEALQARKAASVTTNDGMPSRATRRPMRKPMTAPVARQARSASGQGQPWRVITTPMTAAAAAGGEAGRQVDLAEQQHEDQAHRDDDDRRATG